MMMWRRESRGIWDGCGEHSVKPKYKLIKAEVSDFLKDVGFTTKRVPFIPILEGVNLFKKSTNHDCYKGPTLVEALDEIKEPKRSGKPPHSV